MGFVEHLNGEILSESGSTVTYLPIIHPRKIERASPIAVVRFGYPTSVMATFSPLHCSLPIKSCAEACVIYIPSTRTPHLCNPAHRQWQQLLAP